MRTPRLLCAGLVLSSALVEASACEAHARAAAPNTTPNNWTEGPWLFSPARFPDRFQEITFVPATEARRALVAAQRGPRRLVRFTASVETHPTGDFTLRSAEGRSLVVSGSYRRQGDGYVRVDAEKDIYKGLAFTWADDRLVIAPTDQPRIQVYVGSTLRPLDETPQFAAVRRGDHAHLAADAALSEKALTERDAAGRTLLYRAAQLGDTATVKLLLDRGVPADQLNAPPLQRTPLAGAIHAGQVDVLDQLLAVGANPNHPDAHGARPLHIAGEGTKAYGQIVERLLAAGADPTLADNSGKTPRDRLLRAGATGYLKVFDRQLAAAKPAKTTASVTP